MTKAERKRLKKNRMCAGKDGCGAKQLNHRLFFQLSCFDQLPCAFFFNCWSEAFGVAYVPRPQTKSACTPLQPCAMPKDGGVCAVGAFVRVPRAVGGF
jgi:hypothetical protein